MKRKTLILLVGFIIIVINVVIFASVYQKSLAPDSSSAATNIKTLLTLNSPASVSNVPAGTTITVSLSLQNTTGITVGEIVLSYDTAVLNGGTISEVLSSTTGEAYVLALNKNVNNATGKITIDIANAGSGDLPANTSLVNFTFTTKASSSPVALTTIAMDPLTTLGSPNQLASTGLGVLVLKFIPTKCGDGKIQTPNDSGVNEACDNGSTNGTVCTPSYNNSCQYCTTNCTLQTVQNTKCGDGAKQNTEACDDGNTSAP